MAKQRMHAMRTRALHHGRLVKFERVTKDFYFRCVIIGTSELFERKQSGEITFWDVEISACVPHLAVYVTTCPNLRRTRGQPDEIESKSRRRTDR